MQIVCSYLLFVLFSCVYVYIMRIVESINPLNVVYKFSSSCVLNEIIICLCVIEYVATCIHRCDHEIKMRLESEMYKLTRKMKRNRSIHEDACHSHTTYRQKHISNSCSRSDALHIC